MATGNLAGYPSMPTTPARAAAAVSSRRGGGSGGRGQTVEKQKGLKLFSTKVCEKVRQKGKTTYNEVADELVQEVQEERQGLTGEQQGFDQKNIRRRVYDALNVLMAIHIIAKEKKEIRWIGLPTNSASECAKLEEEKRRAEERIAKKKRELQDVLLQQIAFSRLVERNKSMPQESPPAPNSSVRLPFLLLKTSKNTVIECSISNDRTEYSFDFDQPYEILSDADVMNMMRMSLGLADGTCTEEELAKARQLVPKRFVQYIDELYMNKGRQPIAIGSEMEAAASLASADPATAAMAMAASVDAAAPVLGMPMEAMASAVSASGITPVSMAPSFLHTLSMDNGLDRSEESSEESLSVD
ncbi:transcription factor Dp-1-like isoform X1 [Sycon ciliatum]|uniref:transcription factor Dp-1-like isoform X1 n=1 Tax=Sycon ciliatum TaxID=27933 RepID=UPI0031F6CB31